MKEYVLDRFGAELAEELRAWPPADLAWSSEGERARWAGGAVAHPRDDVIRLALEVARLDLAREFEQVEAHLAREAHRLQTPSEEAALHLLVRLITEQCLGLKEHAEGARLRREDLAGALDLVERRLFRVTLG